MIRENSKVRFSLWAVLAFIVLLGAICVNFLNADQVKTKEKQQEIIQRITKLEMQYSFIIEKLGTLTIVIEKATDKLDKHREESKRGNR